LSRSVPRANLTYLHPSRSSLISYWVHSSSPSPSTAHPTSRSITTDPASASMPRSHLHDQDRRPHSGPSAPMPQRMMHHQSSCGRHVTDATMRHPAASSASTSSADLGLEGSNPRFPHSISMLPFADAPSAPQDHCAQALSHPRLEAHIGHPVPQSRRYPLSFMQTAAIVLLLSRPMSRCHTRPATQCFLLYR